MDERLEKAIKNRDIIVSAYSLHVGKLLELKGMSSYKSVCFNRIMDVADRFDLNVFVDLQDGDLCLDRVALLFCQDIIAGYVGESFIKEVVEYIDIMCKISEMQTVQLTSLRKSDIKTLKSALKNPPTDLCDNNGIMDEWKELIQLEIKCRNPLYLAYIGIKKSLWKIVLPVIKYFKIKLVFN